VTRATLSSATESAPLDEALLARIEAGDNSALELLYERYASAVYGLALRMLGASQAAEEVVQDTFWRVWRRSATFQPGRGQVAPWLLGIAHNLCIDELRRRRARGQMVFDTDEQPVLRDRPDAGLAVDEEVWVRERRQVIVQALGQLPPEQRRVIELAFFSGLSQREIAEQTGDPLGTIKTRVRLGLRKLKELLGGRELGDDI
jgi:RNA polymerase sigma-70 factor, ECF subfamily